MSSSFQHDRPSTDALAGKDDSPNENEMEEEEEEEDTHSCGKCHQVFVSIEEYLLHKMKTHKVKVKYHKAGRRMIIPKFIETLKNLKKEPQDAENLEPKVRHKRAKLFHSEANIIQTSTYQCSSCNKSFRREAALKRHVEFDHRKANDSDDEDMLVEEFKEEGAEDESEDYKQPNKKSPKYKTVGVVVPLEKCIEKADEADRPYACSECDRRFKDVPVLRAHMLTHSDQRDFVCTFPKCTYSFKTKGSLKRHMRRHTGERPYKCRLCGRCFGESGALTRHMKSRTPCTSKSDTDLPRYGKRLQFLDFDKAGEPAVVLLPGNNTQQLQQGGEQMGNFQNITEVPAQGETLEIGTDGNQEIWPEGAIMIVSDTTVQNQCKACQEVFENETDLKAHLNTHLANLPFRCGLCTFATVGREQLNEHMQQMHQTKLKSLQEQPANQDIPHLISVQPAVAEPAESNPEQLEQEETELQFQQQIQEVILTEESTEQVIEISEENVTGEVVEIFNEGQQLVMGDDGHVVIYERQEDREGLVVQIETQDAEAAEQNQQEQMVLQVAQETSEENSVEQSDITAESEILENEQVQDRVEKDSRDAAIAMEQLIELRDSSDTQPVSPSGNHGFKNVHKCLICNRSFRGASYLRLHLRTHAGDRPYKCSHCFKAFTTKDTLNKHILCHSDDRTYKCGECGKMFKRISHVREHLKIHTNERPFGCSVCDKSFKTANACKVHMRTHTPDMPWECQYCPRHFREKGSLERHMRTHTGEKPYRCIHCNRSFAEHGTLNRHLKAKVPCTKQLHQEREAQKRSSLDGTEETSEFASNLEAHEVSEDDANSLLAEFSSVVTDTQQYIIQTDTQAEETEVATEYVLVQDGEDTESIQNIEIMTEHEQGMGLPLENAEYVLLSSGDENVTVAMVDSETGQVVPVSGQTLITVEQENTETVPTPNEPIEAIAMAPDSDTIHQAMLVANMVEEETEVE